MEYFAESIIKILLYKCKDFPLVLSNIDINCHFTLLIMLKFVQFISKIEHFLSLLIHFLCLTGHVKRENVRPFQILADSVTSVAKNLEQAFE